MASINPQPSPLTVTAGSLETFTIYSPELDRDFTIDVLLPDDYSADNHHPVIYAHDGNVLFDRSAVEGKGSWEFDEAVGRYCANEDRKPGEVGPIVVGIYSNSDTRFSDMMPTEMIDLIEPSVVHRLLDELCPTGFNGDLYVDFIVGTLKPEIDAYYATSPDCEHTLLIGASMGGLVSIYAICRHPDVFGAAACLSTHWLCSMNITEIFPTAVNAYLLKNLPNDGKHRFYFDNGTVGLDESYTPFFKRAIDMMVQMGVPMTALTSRLFIGHGHDEASWAKRLDEPLQFLMNFKTPSGVDGPEADKPQDDGEGENTYYNIVGQEVKNPSNGIFIQTSNRKIGKKINK